MPRHLRQYRRNTKRHPFEKNRPFNDQRFRAMESALYLVFDMDVANAMLARYQLYTTERGHIYAAALSAADKQTKRGPERREMHNVITRAHHACFNYPAI